MRCNDFDSHATHIHGSDNPFSVEVGDGPEKLQLELTELQHDSVLRCVFTQEVLITFHASLLVSRFCIWQSMYVWRGVFKYETKQIEV
jgi:hypothetical protein